MSYNPEFAPSVEDLKEIGRAACGEDQVVFKEERVMKDEYDFSDGIRGRSVPVEKYLTLRRKFTQAEERQAVAERLLRNIQDAIYVASQPNRIREQRRQIHIYMNQWKDDIEAFLSTSTPSDYVVVRFEGNDLVNILIAIDSTFDNVPDIQNRLRSLFIK